MGVPVCKPCSTNKELEEIIFSNRYKKSPYNSVNNNTLKDIVYV